MKIIKRNGAEVPFDIQKIEVAVTKANNSVAEADRMTPVQIRRIAESVELQCQKMNRAPTVEEIQDMVEHHIMAHGAFEVAKHYITYRYTRSLVRKANTTDDKILSLIERSFVLDGLMDQPTQDAMFAAVAKKYCTEPLFIKTHPRDTTDYSKLFPTAVILPRTMPSEVLNFCLPFKFQRAVTVQSWVLRGFTAAEEKVFVGLEEAEKLVQG